MSKTAMQILLSERVISFNPLLAHIAGDVKGGLFLSQCCFLSRIHGDKDGWFYSTDEQWFEATLMGRKEITRVRSILNKLGVIYHKVRGQAHKTYYKVSWERLEALLIDQSESSSINAQNDEKAICENETVKIRTNSQKGHLQPSQTDICKHPKGLFANSQKGHTKREVREKEEKINKKAFSAEKDKGESESVDKSEARLKFEEAKRELVKGTGLRPKKPQAEAA